MVTVQLSYIQGFVKKMGDKLNAVPDDVYKQGLAIIETGVIPD